MRGRVGGGRSENNGRARCYRLTGAGEKLLETEARLGADSGDYCDFLK